MSHHQPYQAGQETWADPNGVVYLNFGRVRRMGDGSLLWLSMEPQTFVSAREISGRPAVYHHEIAAQLIGQESARGQYAQPRATGGYSPEDVTCFHAGYADVNVADRAQWPPILLQWGATAADQSNLVQDQHRWWVREGKLVLNRAGKPMRWFVELPLTISSRLEAAHLEIFRRSNMGILLEDIQDRCVNPGFRARTVGEYARRFRDAHGLICWNERNDPRSTKEAWLVARAGPLRRALNHIGAVPGLRLPALPRPNQHELTAINNSQRAPRTESWDWQNLPRQLYNAIASNIQNQLGITLPPPPPPPTIQQTGTQTGMQAGSSNFGGGGQAAGGGPQAGSSSGNTSTRGMGRGYRGGRARGGGRGRGGRGG